MSREGEDEVRVECCGALQSQGNVELFTPVFGSGSKIKEIMSCLDDWA